MAEKPRIRELYIEELADVHGGSGWCPDDIEIGRIVSIQQPCYTTQACCEEGNDPCCQ